MVTALGADRVTVWPMEPEAGDCSTKLLIWSEMKLASLISLLQFIHTQRSQRVSDTRLTRKKCHEAKQQLEFGAFLGSSHNENKYSLPTVL